MTPGTLRAFETMHTGGTDAISTGVTHIPRPALVEGLSATLTRNKHSRNCLKFQNNVANINIFPNITKYYHLIMIVVGLRITSHEGILAKTVEINAEAYVPNSPRSWHCCMQP